MFKMEEVRYDKMSLIAAPSDGIIKEVYTHKVIIFSFDLRFCFRA